MNRTVMVVLTLVSVQAFAQQGGQARPKITGIDHVDFYTTDAASIEHLYGSVLGLTSASPVETGDRTRFIVGAQWVGYSSALDLKSTNRMSHVALRTDDCERMRAYLAAQGVTTQGPVVKGKNGSRSFRVNDPEGHTIEFVQTAKAAAVKSKAQMTPPDPISRRIIHAGFVVRDRAAEDHFYKDILGFRPYWHGGMQNDRDDWVAMQVPDGTDWVEYMLNIKPDADQRTTGVMNHVSLGVKDIKAAQAKLEARGWKANDREHAQMGRDGKWQLNMYDADQTRIELMEFTPAEKPCCSEFQGQHPSE